MEKKINKFLYWSPRVLSIVFIIFLAMFSLDVFAGNYGFWGTAVGLLVHNIPTLILLAILLISWKYEIVGGIVFIIGGILYEGMMIMNALRHPLEAYTLSNSLIISVPMFVIGILFLINWFKKTRTS